jgi:hypothetical protein
VVLGTLTVGVGGALFTLINVIVIANTGSHIADYLLQQKVVFAHCCKGV